MRMSKKRVVQTGFMGVVLLLFSGCAVDYLAESVPPVYWHGALQERQTEVFGGMRGGNATVADFIRPPGVTLPYLSTFLGIGKQSPLFRGDVIAWVGHGWKKGTLLKGNASTSLDERLSLWAVHFAVDAAITPPLGKRSKLELGVGSSWGYETHNYAFRLVDPTQVPSYVPLDATVWTRGLFLGFTLASKKGDKLFGIRSYFLGNQRGLLIGYRIRRWAIWVGNTALLNIVIGLRYHVDLKSTSGK